MKKKFLTILLAVLVMPAALAACGQTAQDTEPAPSAESTPAAESVKEETDTSSAAEPAPTTDSSAAESVTESTEPTPEPDYTTAYAAYLQVLNENKSDIAAYDWQNTVWDGDIYSYGPTYPVALADVYGDAAPELLFMRVAGEFSGQANLVVCTYEGGSAKFIYDEALDLEVAGGTCYCVFYGKDRTLYIYDSIGDEGIEYRYSQLAPADGKMIVEQKIFHASYPNENYDAFIDTYYINDDEVSHEDYARFLEAFYQNADKVLISGDNDDEFLIPLADDSRLEAMTYDEAVAELTELSGGANTTQEPVSDQPASAGDILGSLEGRNFTFASGVGAWSSDITFSGDGVFMGSYHDSDMGDAGEGYQYGTIYVCDFSGRFEVANVINANSYTLKLAEISVENPQGEEWIDDEIRYVASAPAGIADGEEFILYLPGTPTSEMSEDALSWYLMPRGLSEDEAPETLPCYGIFNVNTGDAYFSFDA